MDPLDQLLARDPAWRPARELLGRWVEDASRPGAPAALLQEARWWQAHDAALRSDWDRVTELATEGLGEPFSEREAVRLALLHAISGDVEEAQHVLAQAVQWRSDEALLRRFAQTCEAEGLAEAAEIFRRFAGP